MPAILVIDANPAVQQITELTLSSAGYEVVVLDDSSSLLEQLHKASIGLVLCAHSGPGIDGLSACQDIRDESALAATPFVLLAPADHAAAIEDEASACGVNQILAKPFKPEELLTTVRSFVAQPVDLDDNSSLDENISFDAEESKATSKPTPVKSEASAPSEANVAVISDDPILKNTLQALLQKRHVTIASGTSVDTILKSNESYTAVIVEADASTSFGWYKNSHGKLIVIAKNDQTPSKLPADAIVLSRPLSAATILEALNAIAPLKASPQSATAHAHQAARISALVFETLLKDETLLLSPTEQLADAVKDAILRANR